MFSGQGVKPYGQSFTLYTFWLSPHYHMRLGTYETMRLSVSLNCYDCIYVLTGVSNYSAVMIVDTYLHRIRVKRSFPFLLGESNAWTRRVCTYVNLGDHCTGSRGQVCSYERSVVHMTLLRNSSNPFGSRRPENLLRTGGMSSAYLYRLCTCELLG